MRTNSSTTIGKFETLVHLLIWVYICPPTPGDYRNYSVA